MNKSFCQYRKLFFSLILCLLLSGRVMAVVVDFTVSIPDRPDPFPVSKVRITLNVSGDVTGSTLTVRGTTLTNFDSMFSQDVGTEGDKVWYVHSPTDNEIIIILRPYSNLAVSTNLCAKNGSATFPDEWAFSLDTPATITGYRLSSYCAPSDFQCTCARRRIDNTPADWVTPPPGTNNGRHALDVILVLDESGSMGGIVPIDLDPPPWDIKMDVMKWAVEQFIDEWNIESTGVPDDRLGVVMFTTPSVTPLDFSGDFFVERGTLPATDPAHPWNDIKAAVNGRSPGNLTPLGDGIRMAIDNWKADPKNDLSIVLMTNGMQNAGNMVEWGDVTLGQMPELLYLYDTTAAAPVPLRDHCALIQTIGVGAPGSVQDQLLNAISEQTGGISDLVAVNMVDTAFKNTLVDTLKGNTLEIASRIFSTLNSGDEKSDPHEVELNPSVKQAIFVLGWRKWGDALNLEIYNPDSSTTPITPAKNLDNPFYTIQAVDIPDEGSPGLWSVKVVRRGTNDSSIGYHLSIYVVEEKFSYRIDFSKIDFGTGEEIILQAELSEEGVPLKNQQEAVKVDVYRPSTGLGSLMNARDVSLSQTPQGTDPDDPYSQKLNKLLQNKELRRLIEPVKDLKTYILYDSGNFSEHGDKEADDGIYSMKYTKTKVPGQYKFKVTLDTTTTKSGKIYRVEEIKTVVKVKVADPDKSEIYQDKLPGNKRLITIIPEDRFGNFLGPGFEKNITVESSVGTPSAIQDKKVNGTYTTILSNVSPDADPIFTIKLYGTAFFTGPITPPPERWIIGGYFGRNIPHQTLDIIYDPGSSFGGLIEYLFAPRLAVFASVGHNTFASAVAGIDDLKVFNVSANVKVYPLIGTFQFSIFGGGGFYMFDPGDDKFGINAGSAAEYRINKWLSIEAKYNYHHVFTTGDRTIFSTAQGGIRLRF